ncbi:hypothetical protein J3Q64DRAFT_1813665 [Phycomyces blakesleeanus]|uniref:Uncharacterized protein n=1 Tax=Phycomyces blakesleeanus TaxID=4837 RepID=A0ABR3B659_PHYBL
MRDKSFSFETPLPSVDTGIYSRKALTSLYGVDFIAATVSSAAVAPFIAVVDRSIIENANGKQTLNTGLRKGFRNLLANPLRFLATPQFGYVYGTYFSTYIAANTIETTCENYSVDLNRTAFLKFIGTSIVNMSLCIIKDRAFTRMFGVSAAKPLPLLTYLLFAARDSMTIAASFTAPSYISATLQQHKLVSNSDQGNTAAQLVCPAAVQFLSTPLHLYALDLYNRPTVSLWQRARLVKVEYLKSTLARIGRIGPAFGLGGIGNTYIRNLRKTIIDKSTS